MLRSAASRHGFRMKIVCSPVFLKNTDMDIGIRCPVLYTITARVDVASMSISFPASQRHRLWMVSQGRPRQVSELKLPLHSLRLPPLLPLLLLLLLLMTTTTEIFQMMMSLQMTLTRF